jgi:hypothetical protein
LRGVLRFCCLCGNSGNGTEERDGEEGGRKDGAFLAFSLSAPHVGKALFVCVLFTHLADFLAPFCRAPRITRRIMLGLADSHLKAIGLVTFLSILASDSF